YHRCKRLFCFFFFSSRRRHTRSYGDWSSDVCSSDLTPIDFVPMAKTLYPQDPVGPDELMNPQPRLWPATDTVPFHYRHPVTGKPIVLDNSRAREGFKDV